jgi:hypothetical protein
MSTVFRTTIITIASRVLEAISGAFLLAGLCMLITVQASAGNEREWNFRVLLDGSEIGYHRFQLDDFGDRRLLSSEADFEVDFLFFTAYDYRHTTIERWRDGCLAAIDAKTVTNGKRLVVSGERTPDHFVVQKADGSKRLPACVMTFAYWNPGFLGESHLLNPQSGEYVEVDTQTLGPEPLVVRGEQVTATRYRLQAGKLVLDVWYSPDNEWLALESVTGEGRRLRYELP